MHGATRLNAFLARQPSGLPTVLPDELDEDALADLFGRQLTFFVPHEHREGLDVLRPYRNDRSTLSTQLGHKD